MASDEYQSLAQQLDAPELLPFYRDSLRLWANRLALETHLAGTIKHRPALELTAEAAARFWRANNPVVLVSGFDPTTRHQDVRDTLAARLLPLDVADEADGPIAFIRQLFDALGPEANAPPARPDGSRFSSVGTSPSARPTQRRMKPMAPAIYRITTAWATPTS